jgi:hypothetical protein
VLLDLAAGRHYLRKVNLNSSGNITDLFLPPSDAVALALQFPSVVVIDCTFKTNRYKMPLLHFVGATPFNTSFTIGYAFIQREEEADYLWALQALRDSLGKYNPQAATCDCERALILGLKPVYSETKYFICRWHNSKNVFANCLKWIPDELWEDFLQQWQKIFNAADEDEFEDLWMVINVD